jgi:hypothetical protein
MDASEVAQPLMLPPIASQDSPGARKLDLPGSSRLPLADLARGDFQLASSKQPLIKLIVAVE